MAKKKQVKKAGAIRDFIASIKEFALNRSTHAAFGLVVLFFAIALLSASLSFLVNWQSDFSLSNQSFVELMQNTDINANNIFGNLGFALGYTFVYKWFGISTILVALFIGFIGLRITFQWKLVRLLKFLRKFQSYHWVIV